MWSSNLAAEIADEFDFGDQDEVELQNYAKYLHRQWKKNIAYHKQRDKERALRGTIKVQCKGCGKEFSRRCATGRLPLFCCVQCKKNKWSRHYRKTTNVYERENERRQQDRDMRRTMTFTCKECGKEFTRRHTIGPEPIYCCSVCRSLHFYHSHQEECNAAQYARFDKKRSMRKTITLLCKGCGRKFSRIEHSRGRLPLFCSSACRICQRRRRMIQ